MNAVKKDVEELVVKELNSANEQFPLFASLHEGYAVMLEEVEEVKEALESIDYYKVKLWEAIKQNIQVNALTEAKIIKTLATHLACEAIQVAAMAEKMIVSERKRNEKERHN